jgi:DNA-binding MarR family transcriptional regulator
VGSQTFKDKLEGEKSKRTLQLLFRASRLLNERAIEHVRERTGKPVRIAHTSLFPHVDLDGTRLTVLADRLGVTKQAAGQLVDELEEMGMLERIPDPDDARAKLVRFSKRGQQGLMEGLAVLAVLETQIREAIGEAKMQALHDALASIVAAEEEGPAENAKAQSRPRKERRSAR